MPRSSLPPFVAVLFVSGPTATLPGGKGSAGAIVRVNSHDEVVARAVNLIIGRAANETGPSALPESCGQDLAGKTACGKDVIVDAVSYQSAFGSSPL
jgi:hypothetical protein